MTLPAKRLRRRIGVLAFHLCLLALPVLTGWQAPAHASGGQASAAVDDFSIDYDGTAPSSPFCSPHPPVTGKAVAGAGAG